MCFDALWCTGFRARATAPWLSLRTTGIQLGSVCRNVTAILPSHKASLVASDAATNSASAIDMAVHSKRFDLHDICVDLVHFTKFAYYDALDSSVAHTILCKHKLPSSLMMLAQPKVLNNPIVKDCLFKLQVQAILSHHLHDSQGTHRKVVYPNQ